MKVTELANGTSCNSKLYLLSPKFHHTPLKNVEAKSNLTVYCVDKFKNYQEKRTLES